MTITKIEHNWEALFWQLVALLQKERSGPILSDHAEVNKLIEYAAGLPLFEVVDGFVNAADVKR